MQDFIHCFWEIRQNVKIANSYKSTMYKTYFPRLLPVPKNVDISIVFKNDSLHNVNYK